MLFSGKPVGSSTSGRITRLADESTEAKIEEPLETTEVSLVPQPIEPIPTPASEDNETSIDLSEMIVAKDKFILDGTEVNISLHSNLISYLCHNDVVLLCFVSTIFYFSCDKIK